MEKGIVLSLDLVWAGIIIFSTVFLFLWHFGSGIEEQENSLRMAKLREKALMATDSMVKNGEGFGLGEMDLEKKRVKANFLDLGKLKTAELSGLGVKKVSIFIGGKEFKEMDEGAEGNCFSVERLVLVKGTPSPSKGLLRVVFCG